MNIAIIPARGGSKRIPRKNIKHFCGKPIIAWSIEVARASGLFEHIVVSTDDDEIADVSRQWGAEVPFMRPASLADDFANTFQVMSHTLKELNATGISVGSACCLYPTAPFVQVKDLVSAHNTLVNSQCSYVFAATTFDFPIQRAFSLEKNGAVNMLQPEYAFLRSQDLPEVFHDAGQFCWGKPECFMDLISPFDGNSRIQVLPRYRVQDIDTPDDWVNAELMFASLSKRG